MSDGSEDAAAKLYAQGMKLAKNSDWPAAEAAFRQAAELAPKASLTWLSVAIACCHQGRYEQAVLAIEWALHAATPIRETPESVLGVARWEAADWRGVEEAFRPLLQKEPIDSPTHLFLAIALINQNRVQEGVNELMAGYRMEIAESES